MSGDRYYISDQQGTYFCTFTVVQWIDIFSRKEYRDVIVDSLNYCIQNKGLVVYSWVIMTNHVHVIAKTKAPFKFSNVLRDMKKFMSKKILKTIHQINESRREWLLDKFSYEAKRTKRGKDYKVWQDSNHAVLMDNSMDIFQKIRYIHENPTRAAWVENIEEYLYSSARDYAGKKGLVDVVVL